MDDTVAAIAERDLGAPPDAVAPVAEGLQHETYVLTVNSRGYVLQFAASGDSRDVEPLARGRHCYVALRETEIPVPRVVSERVAEFDDRRYVLVERLPGTTGERDVSPARTRNAAATLAAIHDHAAFDTAGVLVGAGGELSVRACGDATFREWVQREVSESAGHLRDAGLGSIADGLEDVLDEFADHLPESFDPVLCHGDFSPDNVLFSDDEVVGVLDFDRARAGRAEWDLAAAANAFWMHDPTADWCVRETFYEGYRAVRPVAGSFDRCEPLYRAATLARLVAGMLALDELSAYERDFYAERLQNAVGRASRELGRQ
ncbi:phosphotransferase enzyme family protein [Halobacterium sp. MBLA0001]